ncbi:MAG TPA: dipeptide/oligopeptide/nickel ABC transporter ATP-binding protein, partial [Verrucomicrobiales bacterium]|nr:dipeptide/oligopeptide/nickel ABC transporter ATP-binding protein [Verrucomicrobiales bacterium]
CYSLLGLIPQPPGKIHAGSAIFRGSGDRAGLDLLSSSEKQLAGIRGKKISMIFQDPMTSLNPYLKISKQLTEPLEIHENTSRPDALKKAIRALEEVGIPEASKRIHSYPHEFSGGMRQRVMIAMALITRPEILIADEPSTALDVTVQKQVLDLLKERQKALGLSIILITHDLAVVSESCDVVNVMYAGRIVEHAQTSELFSKPLHAYTRSLLKSIPATHQSGEPLYTIPGIPPDLSQEPNHCSFSPRNTIGDQSLCLTEERPELEEVSEGHFVQNCPGCVAR